MLISEVQHDYARQISGKAVKLGLDSREFLGNNGLIPFISIVFKLTLQS